MTIIDQIALTPAELADPQVELGFSHGSASSDVITALYAFGSGNTLASFNGTLTALGSTDISTDLFTPSLNWTQSGFETIDPVPEPTSLAILLVGLLGLGMFRRYHNAQDLAARSWKPEGSISRWFAVCVGYSAAKGARTAGTSARSARAIGCGHHLSSHSLTSRGALAARSVG